MKEDFKRILDILISGTPDEYRMAKKEIPKIWGSNLTKVNMFKKNAIILFDYLEKFDDIKKIKNQEAFISGISLFYLVLADDYFEKLSDFTLKVIQNPDGHVREAIRKTADWLNISLSARLNPFTFPKRKLNSEEIEEQKNACRQLNDYLTKIENLLEKYSGDEDFEYIEDMKPSVEKSLQFLWNRVSDQLKYSVQSHPDILKKRYEIKKKIEEEIKHGKWEISLFEIENLIWEEQGGDDFGSLVKNFDGANSLNELNKILQLIHDAWNYFPHKSLRGLSPVEKQLDALN